MLNGPDQIAESLDEMGAHLILRLMVLLEGDGNLLDGPDEMLERRVDFLKVDGDPLKLIDGKVKIIGTHALRNLSSSEIGMSL
jgi:hypothetical protein